MNEVRTICAECRFADWKKTANGRRHPDNSGRCSFQIPALPRWFPVDRGSRYIWFKSRDVGECAAFAPKQE